MPEPALIGPHDGEVIGDAPDRRVEILSDHDSLNATWTRFAPGREGADLHVHRRHSDLFYVLEGEFGLRLGRAGATVTVPAGALARVPPNVIHGFRNGGDRELRYLNLHAPGRRFADYLRAMRDGREFSYDQFPPPPDGERPATDAVIGDREVVADRSDLHVALLADVDDIAVAEVTAGAAPEAAHIHDRHLESLYVLEGELALTLDGRELRAPTGSWAQIPAGVAHRWAPAGAATVRVLELHTPGGGLGAFLRAVHEAGEDPVAAAARTGFDRRPAT
jgi:quercetin dioxygenase-like cupin family protein